MGQDCIACMHGFSLNSKESSIHHTNIKKCKDKEAYRAAAGPKLLVLAVVLILYGAEDLYNTYVQSTGKLFWVMLVLVLAVLVWFAWTVKKLNAKYF